MIRIQYIIIFIFFASSGVVSAQQEKEVTLKNPSFEGVPHDATNPSGWSLCGAGSTLIFFQGHGVYQKPTEGNTYLGLITREKNGCEAIEQRLRVPSKK